jgi:AAHS family 4-hydroxybenzoate transporter-like MFS transporter
METRAKLNVAELVDGSRLGAFQIGIFILCGLCLMMDGFDVQAMGYVAPEIIREWQVPPGSMGQVLSAAPFGILFGSLLFSMLADRFGRRPVLIGVTFYFAVLTLLTARASNADQLLIIRIIAGIGLGGIMPNAVALCGEYSPKASRVTVMMVVANCFSAGAALGGFFAAWLIPRFGWRSVFYFGGLIPLVISLVMLLALPESLQFLAQRRNDLGRLRKWLRRAVPDVAVTGETDFVIPEPPKKGVPIVHLFHDGRAMGTVALWVINFMNLLNLYFLANWLPAVTRDAGYATDTAVRVAATLQLAGTAGAFILGWMVHKIGFVPVLATGFVLASVNIYMIGQPGHSVATMFLVVALAGVGVVGGQAGVNALAATYYPTDLRSTGVGAGLGIGRTGAIVGPTVAGYLIGMKWTNDQLFLAAAIPALISAVVMLGMRWFMKPAPARGAARPVAAH